MGLAVGRHKLGISLACEVGNERICESDFPRLGGDTNVSQMVGASEMVLGSKDIRESWGGRVKRLAPVKSGVNDESFCVAFEEAETEYVGLSIFGAKVGK